MPRIRPERLALLGLFIALGIFLSVGTVLPRTTTTIFASPDETAVALFARGWTFHEGFRIPTGLPQAASEIAGLHPRSMVQQEAWLVPVGFLGMPMLAMPFEKIWEGSAGFLTLLLVISSVFPLWQFASRMGRRAALTASVVYLSFPIVLLYANRGLFPNLPVVALGLWSVWLVGEKERWKIIVGGLLLGLALTIRPVEGLWLIPWVVWRAWKKDWWIAVLATLIFPVLGYLAAVQTYQTIHPTIGYWVADHPMRVTAGIRETLVELELPQATQVLPYGIHPRTLQLNIRLFWLEMFWPWIFLAFAGVVQLWWRDRITWKSPVIWLGAWTVVVICLFYGQALYLDNIRGTPAIGNSFLRYSLPLVPLLALAIGAWAELLMRDKRRTIIATAVIIALALFGVGTAIARDEESIAKTQRELQRYVEIRTEAAQLLKPGTIVVSERSDKIFAGLPNIVAVSPLPSMETIQWIVGRDLVTAAHAPSIAWFHRKLTPQEMEASAMKLTELLHQGNEVLYQVESLVFE